MNDMEKIKLIISIVLLFGFLIMNVISQQKRARSFMKMQDRLKIGSRIIFSSGLHGTIEELDKTTMKVRCGDHLLEAERACVQGIIE